ncbi:hypothetical protein D3C85_1477980 [compost metagenome]
MEQVAFKCAERLLAFSPTERRLKHRVGENRAFLPWLSHQLLSEVVTKGWVLKR